MPYDGDVSNHQTSVEFRVLTLLRSARKLVEAGWTQGMNGVTLADGSQAESVIDPLATNFCAFQAVNRAAIYEDEQLRDRLPCTAQLAINALQARLRTTSLIAWNDCHERTQDEVIALFDGVIAKLEVR